MKKIKNVLLFVLFLIVIEIVYNLFKYPIKEILAKRKYSKQIVNCMNFESFENIAEVSKERYDYIKNYYNEPNIDISPLIESYIKQVETNEEHPFSGEYAVRLTSNMEREIQCEDYTYIIKLYHGNDRKLSIEDLEKVLIHNSDDKYAGWCIPKDSPQIVDLPYNYYLKYEPSDFKLLDKVKRVTKCTFPNELNFKYNNGKNDIIIEYIDGDNKKQVKSGNVYISEEDDYKITVFYNNLYYFQTHNAKVELHNHYSDKIAEEWQRIHEKDFDDVYWDWDREDCKAIIDKFR